GSRMSTPFDQNKSFAYANPSDNEETLVDLLDRILDVGIIAKGDLTISVADVDLLYVGLKLIACTPDKLADLHQAFQNPVGGVK
ncbi:MAG: gas vesicle protein, partial [Rhizobiaceae bacterium]